jgi:transcriptional antiterminator NusG
MKTEYVKGQIVGYVPIEDLQGPMELPIPQRWYVLRTFPNKEPKVMRTFEDRRIAAYFPTVRSCRIERGRRIEKLSPLFAGTIFIPDFQAHAGGVFVDGVDQYLKFGNYHPYVPQVAPAIKPSAQWESRYVKRDRKLVLDMVGIRQLESEGNIPVARRRRLFKIGQLVRVIDGPFAAFNGTIEHLDSKGRLKVLMDIFSRMTSVELDEGQLEAA